MAASAKPAIARWVLLLLAFASASLAAPGVVAQVVAQTAAPQPPSAPSASAVPPAALGLVPSPAAGRDGELPAFLDDQRLRVIEDAARPRMEAIEQKRAEKLKRRAIEADAKRKAEEMRRSVEEQGQGAASSAAAEAKTPPVLMRAGAAVVAPAAAAPALLPARQQTTECTPPRVAPNPLIGGRVTIEIEAPCRPGELVTISYAPFVFQRPLDGRGRLSFVLDLFQGAEPPVAVVLANGDRLPVTLGETDIARVAKVAVVWGKPVNIDLHAFEYASPRDGDGHRWTRAPSTAEEALEATRRTKRGHGFVSFTSEGRMPGHQVEVYTLFLHPEQVSGMVTTAVDYESRGTTLSGETCGDGALATVPFETLSLRPGGPVVRERGLISPLPCGSTLVEKARYADEAIPDVEAVLR